MAALDSSLSIRTLLLWLIAGVAIFVVAGPISSVAPSTTLAIALGGVVLAIAFISTEAALYILICSMLLSPQFGASQGGIAEERSVVVRMDDILLILIGFSWFARTAVQKELGLIPHTPLNRPIIFYILACAFPTGLGVMAGRIQPLSGLFYLLKYIEYFVIYYMIVNYMYNVKQAKSFITTALVTCVIICLYGIAQIPSGERVSAPFEGKGGEPNTLGGYLVFMWAIVLGLMLTSHSRRLKRWLIVMSVLIIFPLLFTLSRASWVGAVAMYLALIILSERRVLLIGVGILLIAISPLIIPKQVSLRALNTFKPERGYEATEKLGGLTLDPSASARVTTNRLAFQAWQKQPLLGYGITGSHIFLDSQYFRTLVELGIVGLFGFGWLIWTAFRIGKHNYRTARSDFSRGLSLGYLAGTIGLMVHGIGSTTFIIVRIMEPFWLVTSIVLLLPTIEEVEQEVKQEIEQERRTAKALPHHIQPPPERQSILARDLIRSHLEREAWK